MKNYARMTFERTKREFAGLTNEELFGVYEAVQDYHVLYPLMNEALNRWAWYAHKGDIPQHDTAEETYRQWKD